MTTSTPSGGVLSLWSRSAQSQFYGQDGALALNGDVRTSMFGTDYSKGPMATGVSLSHSRGLRRYTGVDSGQINSGVTGLLPLDRLQGQRAGHRLDRRRLRRRRTDAQPGRWSTYRDRAIDGDGCRRWPRADPRRRRGVSAKRSRQTRYGSECGRRPQPGPAATSTRRRLGSAGYAPRSKARRA